MREMNGETLLTLKEASEKFFVPTYWLRRQLGKPRLPNGKVVRFVKFPSDKNYYVYLSDVEQLAMPRVFNPDYIEESQRQYDKDPEFQPSEVPDYEWKDEEK